MEPPVALIACTDTEDNPPGTLVASAGRTVVLASLVYHLEVVIRAAGNLVVEP